jgi:hypothetical protein
LLIIDAEFVVIVDAVDNDAVGIGVAIGVA